MGIISMTSNLSISQLKCRVLLAVLKKRGLTVGKNFYQGTDVVLDPSFPWLIKIGDDVTLVSRVFILAHDASTKRHLNYSKVGKVSIGNRVFVGAGSIILPGVTIGDNVVIGAGSVVAKDIPSESVANGAPARVTGTIEEFLVRKKSEMQDFPIFEKEYTLEGNVTKDKRREMNERMRDRYGYIV